MAKTAFAKFKKYLICPGVTLNLRLRVVKCYLWPILLYETETWSMQVKVSNEVLPRARVDRKLLKVMKQPKVSYL